MDNGCLAPALACIGADKYSETLPARNIPQWFMTGGHAAGVDRHAGVEECIAPVGPLPQTDDRGLAARFRNLRLKHQWTPGFSRIRAPADQFLTLGKRKFATAADDEIEPAIGEFRSHAFIPLPGCF